MRKIALICTSLNELGGKNNHLKNIFFGLENQFEVYIIVASSVEDDLRQFFFNSKVPSERLLFLSRNKKWFIIPFLFDLVKFLREKNIDIVHTFQEQSDVLGGLAARLAGVKNLFSYYESKIIPENISFFKAFMYRIMNVIMQGWFRKTVVVSQGLRKEILKMNYRASDSVEVIPLGIQVPLRYAEKDYLAENLKNNTPVVGTIARFSHEKALDRIITASVLFLQKFPRSRFILIGSGPQELLLKNLVKELKVDAYFTFMPWTNNVYEALTEIDIFVMPSKREGCPLALLEALGMKRPIIASDIEGIRDIIEHDKDGILVDTSSDQLLSHCMAELCRNPGKAIRLGRQGFEKVMDRFTIVSEMKKIAELYQDNK